MFNETFDTVMHFNCDNKPLPDTDRIDIVTVAFNNKHVIAHQIRLVQKNLLDGHHYTVADNSADPQKQKEIMQLCHESAATYVKIPNNPYSGSDPSMSHGMALNWIYENYLKPRQAKFFGFLDHDVFPVHPTQIMGFLHNYYVYGLIQEREETWYLWPGFCFFQYDYVKDKRVDFRPGGGRDTGGQNWESIYANLDKSKIPYLIQECVPLLSDGSDVICCGDWLHLYNASNWTKTQDKTELFNELLNKY